MGYQLSQTLTTKGYKRQLNKQNNNYKFYSDINQTQVYKYLMKLVNTLKTKDVFRDNQREIIRLLLCHPDQQLNQNRSYPNRQMFILEMDKRISFNVGIKKDLMLRKQAMRCIGKQMFQFIYTRQRQRNGIQYQNTRQHWNRILQLNRINYERQMLRNRRENNLITNLNNNTNINNRQQQQINQRPRWITREFLIENQRMRDVQLQQQLSAHLHEQEQQIARRQQQMQLPEHQSSDQASFYYDVLDQEQ